VRGDAMHHQIDFIDSHHSLSEGTSPPPIEVLIVFAEEMGIITVWIKPSSSKSRPSCSISLKNLKVFRITVSFTSRCGMKILTETGQQIIELVADNKAALEQAIPLMRQLLKRLNYPDFDDKIFEAQVPGGMLTNLYNQMKEMGQLEMMDQVLAEIPQVRADAGYVPLVTPTSQIIGSQAAFNVMNGRYALVPSRLR
jgi:pyruvate/oxaloacetate carboxyltransferase